MERIRILLVLLLFPVVIGAQTSETIFSRYTVDDGISQSSVSCILQDSEGYIWFGTQDGLNKFNGYTFERYYHNPHDSQSISHAWIYSISEDDEGNIWVGTRGGLNKFNKKKATFESFLAHPGNPNSLNSNLVYGITYHKGIIYANTPPVLNILDTKTKHIEQYRNNINIEKKTKSFEKGTPVVVDEHNNVWIATTNGLARFDPIRKEFQNYFYDAANPYSIPDNFINALYRDRQGELWIGTNNGFCKYNRANDHFIRFENKFSNNTILSILQDNSGRFWFGTFGGGLNQTVMNDSKTKLNEITNYSNNINDEKTLISDVVSSLFQDRSHIMWIGCFLGLNKLDLKPKKFNLYKKTESPHSVNLLDNFIASVYKDENHILWIGNWGKGLNLLNLNNNHVTHYTPASAGKYKIVNGYVQVIYKDPDNYMWIATRNGIQVLNPKDSSFVDLNVFFGIKDLPEFRNIRIRRLYTDSHKNTWICCDNGLYKITHGDKKIISYLTTDFQKGLSDNLIYDILEEPNGTFWVATVNGLNFYDPFKNTYTHYFNDPTVPNSLSSSMTISLMLDKDGDLWVGTNSGLNFLKKGSNTFVYFSKKDGLPDEYIYNMIQDAAGKIWISTNRGIAMLDKKTKRIVAYNNEDGLQGLEFNGGACFQCSDGELFFGGVAGLNAFHPDVLPINNFVPPIVITSFEKSNESGKEKKIVKNGDVLELSYSDYEIMIEFAALDFTNSKMNQYAYQMDGLSKEWISTNNRNFVTFSKLSPDKYTFSVRGSNNDKVWNTKGASITLVILPPFWKTWWFYAICILVIAVLIFAFIKFREKSLIKEKRRLEQKVMERTEEVVHQNAQIEKQKNELIKKNIKITDSIDYAKQIQDAFLPSPEQLKQAFPESFVLFKPKDIVSGDFYWLHTRTDKIVFAVADCTGHGVPGAFMSLISINLLNEIMDRKLTTVPARILELLKEQIITSFKQKKGEEKRQNGLDIALCSYDPDTREFSYAGAKNSLYLFRNNTFTEIKADKYTLGMFYEQEHNRFTNHSMVLEKGDVIYLFSDGFADQKGGPSGKKYYYHPFQELCMRIHQLDMKEQKAALEKEIDAWKGNHEQIDDILIMGIRF